MGNICITIPKSIDWKDYEEELKTVEDGSSEMHYKVHVLPKDVCAGDRCYVCYNGFVVGWMNITHIGKLDSFDCSTTGQKWDSWNYISRSGKFHYLEEKIPMKGFMGFKYVDF